MESQQSDAKESATLPTLELESVLQFWRQFDLSTARSLWDKTCNEMREMKTASISGRKRLNDLTKAFRAKSKEEQSNLISELLKAYQEEIDQLSRRSKLSETAYLGIYKSLYEAPDPALYLDQMNNALFTTSSHSLEIERLKTELSQYDEEFQRLKNQEVTIRRLEDQLQEFKENNELKILEEVEKRVLVVRQECEQEVFESKEIQKSIERRLSLALESAKQAQILSDRAQSKLLEVSTQHDEKLSSLIAENSLLSESIQRFQITQAENENEISNLRKLLLDGNKPSGLSSSMADGAEANKLPSYEQLVAQLRDELATQAESFRTEKLKLEASCREQTLQLQKEAETISRLQQELQARPRLEDLRAVKKRLRVVEKIAFPEARGKFGVEAGDSDGELEDYVTRRNRSPENSLETSDVPIEELLTNKIKNLERELLEGKKQLTDLREIETQQRDALASYKNALENKEQLIARLEKELETRNQALEKIVRERQDKKDQALTDLADLIGVSATTASSLQQPSGRGQMIPVPSQPISIAGGIETDGLNAQMITILTNQRDRFKEKLTQAEARILKTEEQLESTRTAKLQLEEENVQLFAKIKFLQSYGHSSAAMTLPSSSSPSKYRKNDFAMDRRGRRDGPAASFPYSEESRFSDETEPDLEAKYDHLYEQRMNPFAAFELHEKQRKLRELSVADRIVLNTTLAIVQNTFGRNFLLIYFGAMHLLVFFTIYYTAHQVHHGCDPALDHLAAATAAVGH